MNIQNLYNKTLSNKLLEMAHFYQKPFYFLHFIFECPNDGHSDVTFSVELTFGEKKFSFVYNFQRCIIHPKRFRTKLHQKVIVVVLSNLF